MKFTVREKINCSAAEFWETFASDEYVHAATKAAGSLSCEVVDHDGAPPAAFSRTVQMVNPVDAPGPAKKLLGDTQTVTDSGAYDPAGGRWTYTVRPSTMGDKIKIRGTITLEERADGTVDKVNELDVSVKIFGLGTMIEKVIEAQTRRSESRNAEAMNHLLDRHR